MNSHIILSTADSFDRDVIKSELPVLVYFYSEDCAPCTALNPLFDRIAETYAEHMRFVKIFRQQNRSFAEELGIKSSPALLFFKDGKEVCTRLYGYITKPELRQAVEMVLGGVCTGKERQKVYCDVLILGGGPAGLTAAIYAARARLYTIVIDEGIPGGQVSTTYHVANYPGTNGVVRGIDLMENMRKQAMDFGAQLEEMKEVEEIKLAGDHKYVMTEDAEYFAKCLIVATGAEPRKLPAEGEKEFRGRGVHYCATCDGAMYMDADLAVVGGGDAAVEEAVFLTRYAKHVTIIHRHDRFRASKAAQEEALINPNIHVLWDTEVKHIQGEGFVKSAVIENVKTGEQRELALDGIFVYIGSQPKTSGFAGLLQMNEYGYILTDEDMKTNIPGVFAAGDVRDKKVRQIATAVGDGAIAGMMAERYINSREG